MQTDIGPNKLKIKLICLRSLSYKKEKYLVFVKHCFLCPNILYFRQPAICLFPWKYYQFMGA